MTAKTKLATKAAFDAAESRSRAVRRSRLLKKIDGALSALPVTWRTDEIQPYLYVLRRSVSVKDGVDLERYLTDLQSLLCESQRWIIGT